MIGLLLVVIGIVGELTENVWPYCPGCVASALVLHPDPWWKKRHHKRRLLTPRFVQMLASVVQPGGELLVQTDVKELMDNMRVVLSGPHAAEDIARGSQLWWMSAGATTAVEHCGLPSSREAYVRSEGGSVYGELYIRTDVACSFDMPRLYCAASHLWLQEIPNRDNPELARVQVGLTERGLDEIGNVLRWSVPSGFDQVPDGGEITQVTGLVAAGDELLRVPTSSPIV